MEVWSNVRLQETQKGVNSYCGVCVAEKLKVDSLTVEENLEEVAQRVHSYHEDDANDSDLD